QVLVRVVVRVLVVQLRIQRPRRGNELAEAKRCERRIARTAVIVLQVETGATGQVPAVVEILGGSHLRENQTCQKGSAQHANFHNLLLNQSGMSRGKAVGMRGQATGPPNLPVAA